MSRFAVLLGIVGVLFQPFASVRAEPPQIAAESDDWWTEDTEIDAGGNQGRSEEHGPGSDDWPPLEAAGRLFG